MEAQVLCMNGSPARFGDRRRGRRPGTVMVLCAALSFLFFGGAARALACTLDAECDDGLACTGIETCVLGSCVAGTPVDCSSLADQCMDCTEPAGTCSTP